jgi:hypothetical protein
MLPPLASLPWLPRLQLACVLLLAVAAWCYHCARRVPPGARRLLLCAPAVALQAALPLALFDRRSEPLSVMGAAFFSWRLGAGKAMALGLGRGALAGLLGGGFSPFAAVALLPIVPAGEWQGGGGNGEGAAARGGAWTRLSMAESAAAAAATAAATARAARAAAPSAPAPPAKAHAPVPGAATSDAHLPPLHAAAIAAAAMAAMAAAPPLPAAALHALSLIFMYCALSSSMSACAAAAARFGLHLVPCFGPPAAATSLAAFWGRCWNLPQSLVLRALVFDPIAEGRGMRRRRAAAAAASRCSQRSCRAAWSTRPSGCR